MAARWYSDNGGRIGYQGGGDVSVVVSDWRQSGLYTVAASTSGVVISVISVSSSSGGV